MRKTIGLFLLLFLALFIIGCDNGDDPKKVTPSAITISAPKTEIFVGDEMSLSYVFSPRNASGNVVWSSEHTDIIEVIDSRAGRIKGVKPGKSEVFVTYESDSKIYDSIEITVNEIVYDDPESIQLINPFTLVNLNGTLQIIARVLPETAAQNVLYESSDEAVATVSASGLINGLSLGEAMITVKVAADPDIFTVINISVIEGSVEVQGIVIQGEKELFEGSTIKLTATVYPSGVSQNVTWQSSHPQIATVSSKGDVTALKQGAATILAISVQDSTVVAYHTITVKTKQVAEPYPNLQGYNIIMLGDDGHLEEHDPFLDDYTLPDKMAKQQAWNYIEQEFNCQIKVQGYPSDYPWGPNRVEWMIQKGQVNEAEGDIYVVTGIWTVALAEGGGLLDTLEWYNKYGNHKMEPAKKTAATYRNGLYALLYSAVDGINVYYGIFYNYNLLNDYDLTSPAKLFNEGQWTYEDFKNYVIEAKSRMTGDYNVLAGKPFLYWAGMVNAGGVALTDTLSLEVNFEHKYAKEAAATLRETYVANCWGDQGWDAESQSFNEGHTLFNIGELWFAIADDRWGKKQWGDDTKFGFVPFPYPDNLTKEDARTVDLGGQYYGFAAGRAYPPSVTAERVYRAWTELILKTGEYMVDDPTFNLDATMRSAAQYYVDDPESAEAMIFFKQDKVIFDPFTWMLSYVENGISSDGIDLIVNGGEDYSQVLYSFAAVYETELRNKYG